MTINLNVITTIYYFGILLVMQPELLLSQKEANNWYFPNRRAISFESGEAVSINNPNMINMEGAASISNSSGELLFYTNGQNVWGRDHGRIEGGWGLSGGYSSTTAALIIKMPGSGSNYFIITTEDESRDSIIMAYSVVALNSHNMYGGRVRVLNHVLLSASAEKVTAVQHENANDIWLIGVDWRNRKILSWQIQDTGLADNPIISDTVTRCDDADEDRIGVMKASPDGAVLTICNYKSGYVLLYRYDTRNGIASRRCEIEMPEGMNPYGIEYSVDSKKLYVSCIPSTSSNYSRLYQFKIDTIATAAIQESMTLVASGGRPGQHAYGALQLDPEGRIYHIYPLDSTFGVIEHPEKLGSDCEYVPTTIPVIESEPRSSYNSASLPAFNQSIFNPLRFAHNNACIGTSSVLKISDLFKCDSIRWFFNDSLSPGATDTGRVVEYLFSSEGRYWVDAIAYREGTADTITQRITVYPQPRVHAMNDTSITRNNTVRLRCQVESGREPYLYYWSPVDRLDDPYAASPTASPDSATMYHVVVTDLTGCVSEDSVFVDIVDEPSITCETRGHDSLYADSHYERFIPDPLFVYYTVTNTGTVAMTGCEASIILPPEFALAGSDSTQSFTAPEYANQPGDPVSEGTILPNASCTRWWLITPTQAIADTAPKLIRWQWTSDQQGKQSGCDHTMHIIPDNPQSIVLTPLHLYFEAEHGRPLPSEQHVQLWTGGGLVMPWTAQPSEWWLDAQPTSGSQSTQISVQPNSTLLDVGAHGADLLFATTPTDRHVAITYVIRKSTGIESPAAPGALTLDAWPQPVAAGAWLHVRIGGEAGGSCRLTLHDLLGRERLTRYAETASPVVIELGALQMPTGVYLLRAIAEDGAKATRLISVTGGR